MAEIKDGDENVIEQDGRRFVDAQYISRLLRNSNVEEDAKQKILEGLQGGAEQEDSDSSMSDYGELEPPPIRPMLKNILQAYPDGSQILRELVQNAEDANASIVRIVHDQRRIEVKELTRKRQLWLKSFRTPAVFLFNDELFRKNDWRGIRKVYSSVKANDSLKIGRFGLGFKSVFHMTDSPIIISGDRVLIISPLEDQSWKVCHTMQLKKVFKKRKYHQLKQLFNQILGCQNAFKLYGIDEESFRKGNYKDESVSGTTTAKIMSQMVPPFDKLLQNYTSYRDKPKLQRDLEGCTLFWFPLRESVSTEDPISCTIYTKDKVEDLFRSFHTEASMVLLFLKHVDHISLHNIGTDDLRCEIFSVEIKSINDDNMHKERRKVSQHLKSFPQSHVIQKSIHSIFQARVVLKDGLKFQESRWFISTLYQGSDDMSPEMRSLLNHKELRYQPYVGVALPFDRDGFSPHVFCFLPLPIEKQGQSLTNLPFHVNGSFALDSNRRHMSWPTNDRTEDKDVSLKWNRLMTTEILPTAFVNLMMHMIDSNVKKETIYNSIPDPEVVDKKWSMILPNLFSRLFAKPIFLTESVPAQPIQFTEAVFSIVSTKGDIGKCNSQILFDIVKMYCPNFIFIPSEASHILQVVQSQFAPSVPEVITPKYIYGLLSQDYEGKYKELSREHKQTLLVFLTSEDNFDYLDSLELMPVNSIKIGFKHFKSTEKATYFIAQQTQTKVLPGLEDTLWTPSDQEMPEVKKIIETLSQKGLYGIMHITDNGIFQELLRRSLEIITERDGNNEKQFLLKKDRVRSDWISLLWEYLSKNIDDFRTVENLPILPIFDEYGNFLRLQNLTGQYIAKKENGGNNHETCLPESIHHILDTLNICVLHYVPDFIANCRQHRKYVCSPNSDGITLILKQCLSSCPQVEMANKINKLCTEKDLLEFAQFLTKNELPDKFSEFMRYAHLFKTTEIDGREGHELCSVNDCKEMVPYLTHTLPVRLPRRFLAFSKKTLPLAEKLGVTKMEEVELIEVILKHIDNAECYHFYDVQRFMLFFLEHYVFKTSETCLSLASDVRFLSDHQNVPRVANHFFDPTDKELQTLFVGEKTRFPNPPDFPWDMVENARKIGLRSSKDLHWKDLLEVATNITTLKSETGMRNKSEMLVKFMHRLDAEDLLLMKEELKVLKWVPLRSDRPESYLPSLSWYGESGVVCTPCEVVDSGYTNIVGSAQYVCSHTASQVLRGMSFSMEPDFLAVMNHWKHVIHSVDANENTDQILVEIFQYLSGHWKVSGATEVVKKMKELQCISVRETYVAPRCIYLHRTKGNENVNLEPFRYHLPEKYRDFERFFEVLGSTRYLEAENLVSVLYEIRNSCSEIREDTLVLIKGVLHLILECETNVELLSMVILPTESRGAINQFSPVSSSVHVTDVSLLDVKFPKDVKVVDRRIPGEIAQALGVKDILNKLIDIGSISKIPIQKYDSNYRRKSGNLDISCIFSIIKELEKRGSTSIKFVLDERQNKDIKHGQFCSKLSDFQGPSLWILHNAMSKEHVGSEVPLLENISDLPCIFTKSSLTMFDVNGDIFEDQSSRSQSGSGIYIKFEQENAWLLKEFPNSFTLYQDMCGEKFIDNLAQLSSFETTIYRLPLRNEIVNRDENSCLLSTENIHELFQTLNHTVGDFLIFSENLEALEVCFISENSVSSQNSRIMYRAESEILHIVKDGNSRVIEKSISVQNFKWIETGDQNEHRTTWLLSKKKNSMDDIGDGIGYVALPKDNLFLNEGALTRVEGFSTYGKVFKILPLNEKTVFSVHINGNFDLNNEMLSRNNFEEVERNKSLLKRDAAPSYAFLMHHLPSNLIDSKSLYYSLWPRFNDDDLFNVLVRAFYENILRENLELFKSHGHAVGLQECCFLDFKLRYTEDIGDIAQTCFRECHNREGQQNIDIPKVIYEQLQAANLASKLQILEEEMFWKHVFFPSLSSEYWDGNHNDRNKLIVHAIKRSDELNLISFIGKTRCVPTAPNGELTKPYDLVHIKPGSVISGLFVEEDGRFVQDLDEFNSTAIREKLFKLGMMQETLRLEVLAERAKSVSDLYSSDPRMGTSRYSAILTYLKSLTKDDYMSAVSVIRIIPWIPIVTSISPYPSSVHWYGKGRTHCNMDEGYLFEHRYLIGTMAYVYVDNADLESLLYSRQPGEREVTDNFLRVIENFAEGKYERGYDEIVQEVYSFFANRYEISDDCIQRLKSQKCIWTRDKFVLPEKVCLNFSLGVKEESLAPFMYCFDNRFDDMKYSPFFRNIGCHEHLTVELILEILETMNDKIPLDDSCLDDDSYLDLERCLDVVLAIIDTVSKIELSEDQKARMMLPVKFQNRWKMCKLSDCAYISDDSHPLMASSDDDANILVGKIGIETAEHLGVQSLNQRLLKENDAEEMICEWGQSEPLTTRIKRLLEEYSDGFSIPKELLQNADDAGATELTFIYDERENNDLRSGLLDEGMAECQGPALWVYNNSMFEETDFKNIIMLDGRTKVEETSKIGKFGLGFCSVYNITDVPSFVSGNSIVIFDPNTFHLGRVIKDKSSPGLRIKLKKGSKEFLKRFKNQFTPYNGLCNCNLSGEGDAPYFRGTLFRFPFRTKHQAGKSEIVDHPYKRKDVIDLLNQFIDGAGNLLLFSQNVHTVKIKHIAPNDGVENVSDLCVVQRKNVSCRQERNFLRDVARQDTNYLKENRMKETYEVEISVTTTKHAEEVLEIKENNSSSKWFISYSSGGMNSIQMAEKLRAEGTVSVASVAIPREYQLSNKMQSSDVVPRGFFTDSHIFCFLPLPIEIKMPVHINGSFFVEQSRRGLRQGAGTDSKLANDVDRWNDVLLCDPVCYSYLELLQALPSEFYNDTVIISKEESLDYSHFWPRFEESILRPLSQNFYEQALNEDFQLLFTQIPFEKKIELKNCIFLVPFLRYDQNIGDIAFECSQNFYSGEYILMDMKRQTYDQFCKAGLNDSLRILSAEDFFATLFLPRLTNEFWIQKETKRDMMIVYLLKFLKVEEMAVLVDVMKSSSCIPTRPHGRLVRPHELVNDNSRLIVDLFSDCEERFIQVDRNRAFKDVDVESNLIALGMMTTTLPNDLIVERALSITHLHNPEKKMRCDAFLRLLESLTDQHIQTLASQLNTVAWVPVIEEKPYDYPSCLRWLGESVKLQCPRSVYGEKYRLIVGSCASIHDKNVTQLLERMNMSNTPDIELVLIQLQEIISVNFRGEISMITQSVHEIYTFLYENFNALQRCDAYEQNIKGEPIVWTGRTFIEARHVCCQFDHQIVRNVLEPYKYLLIDEFTHMKPLFVFFGCSEELTFDILLEVQKQIYDKNKGSTSNNSETEDLRVVLNIVTDIVFKFRPARHDDLKELLLPVIHGENGNLKLVPVTECVFTSDNFFLSNADENSQEIQIMDRRIGIEVAENLGVESLASRIMKDNDAEELGEEWGQSEPLTTRIRGLLDDYNDGFAIPKELVQNSDDAGAKIVRFLYDERTNDEYRTGLIDEGMAECQGPALWVFNDACFTEDDFKNITKLAGKTKENERSKIGKFGLGFCSVYNLTDVPSFVSGNSVVILDPHTVHLNKALRNKSSPGIRLRFGEQNKWLLKKLKNQFMPFQGIFGCDLSGTADNPLNFNGTLFRFPLRTRKQANEGSISSYAYSKKEMINLLRKFSASVGSLMIFTQNIEKIEVYRLKENAESDVPELLFDASRQQIGGTGKLNMLHDIVKECLNDFPGKEKNTSIELEINIRTTQEALEFLSVEKQISKYKWFITTSTGGQKTLQMARELEDKGAVPLGCVAISDANIRSSLLQPIEESFGFKGNNRLFCFLPLPVNKITLPVFVNGCFFVEKSRKSLHLPSGDDGMSHDRELKWNQTLLHDAVCNAYLELIELLPIDYFEHAEKNNMYQIWPKYSENPEIFEPLTSGFYAAVTSFAADKKIFVARNKKVGMNDCIFLDFSLRYEESIGQAAHDFLVFLKSPVLRTVTDMPEEIYEQFKQAKCDNKLPVITTVEFFTSYFFRNIKSEFWNMHENDRNLLVLYALSHFSANTDLLNQIKTTACIPTRPHGNLKCPPELVSEVHCTILRELFTDVDERFIQSSVSEQFSDSNILKILVQIGLLTDSLPQEHVCERAESVIVQSTPEEQISRCKALLRYIEKYSCTEALKSIPFLPVLEKPDKWPLSWYCSTDEKKDESENCVMRFEKPMKIASQDLIYIVGSVLPILQQDLLRDISPKVFRRLGVRTNEEMSVEDVLGQLISISQSSFSAENNDLIRKICEETYRFIGEYISEKQYVDLQRFRDLRIILVGHSLVKPRECIMSLPADCQPEFFCVEVNWNMRKKYFVSFFKTIGVRLLEDKEGMNYVNINDILNVLRRYEVHLGKCVDESVACLIINLLTAIYTLVKKKGTGHRLKDEIIEQLLAPDKDNVIRRPKDICIDDNYDKLSDEPNLHIVHDKMTRGLLRMLKIKTKRAQFISQFDLGIPFGQQEKLTTRIRGILEDHPSEISVFNELLQNADDASATEIIFILDKRSHGTEHIFEDTMQDIQGPALCVYNDSSFTNDDIIGISRLGDGSKRHDLSKTGQFGIGFNAVYNITDAPSIFTKGSQTPNGGTLILFDPHYRYFPGSSQPGIRVPSLEIVEQKYPDVFRAHLQMDSTFKREQGTWFRLPLRNWEMATASEIKNKSITTGDIERLFKSFRINAEKSLLFMTSLRKIGVFTIEADGSCSPNFNISVSLDADDHSQLKDFKLKVKTHMDQLKSEETSIKTYTGTEAITYDLHISENDILNRWRVVQNFNTPSGIPENLANAIQTGDIRLSPRGGVAFKLSSETSVEGHSAFCFLPLSMETTGLPLHVNGHFVLHSSRTSIWDDEEGNRITTQGQWNNFILYKVIPYSYVELVISLLKEIEVSDQKADKLNLYYQIFPEYSKCCSNMWKTVTMGMFQMLIDREILAMPIVSYSTRDHLSIQSIRWVSLHKERASPIFFDDILNDYETREQEKRERSIQTTFGVQTNVMSYEEEAERKASALARVFKDIGMKITDAPLWIRKSIIDSNCSVGKVNFVPECIAAISAIKFLKTWSSDLEDKCSLERVNVKVTETVIKTIDRAKLVLEYCFHSGQNAEELDGTPLLVNESKELKVFSIENRLFVSRFAHLLPASRDLFVHKTLVGCLNRYKAGQCIKELTLDDFAGMLHHSFSEDIYTESPLLLTAPQSDILNEKWISSFWDFLQSRHSAEEDIKKCKRILEKWTLLPSKCVETDKTILYSFAEGHAIIDDRSFREPFDNDLADAFRHLRLPKPHFIEQRSKVNLLSFFIATSEKPEEVLKCLFYHRSSLQQLNSTDYMRTSRKILKYITSKKKSFGRTEETTRMLSDIPLHATINNTLTSLPITRKTILLTGISYDMPLDGLAQLMDVSNTIFLKDNPTLHDMYRSLLNVEECNELNFYIQHVLPNLYTLENNYRLVHLTYIRNKIKYGKYNSVETESLKQTMRTIRFIYCPDNHSVQMAMNFYSPHVRLFSLLCDKSELPPAPFHLTEWKELMTLSGMITNASYEKILQFAQHLENTSNGEVSEETEEISQQIVQHTFQQVKKSDISLKSFLEKLGSIHFLCPRRVQDTLQKIYPQHNRSTLIPFRNSILQEGEQLGWTTCDILPEYSNPREYLYMNTDSMKKVQQYLGYLDEPPLSNCLSHVHNICHRQGQEFLIAFEKNEKKQNEITEDLMDTIYRFLSSKIASRTDIGDMQCMLSETPFIYVFQYNLFLTADQVVLKLDQNKEIQPYLCAGPERFGKYFTLFRELGCRDNVNAFHFANTVRCIYLRVSVRHEQCILMPKELEQVRFALLECFNALDEEENSLEALDLYLPNEQDQLVKATSLIFNNKPSYENRLKKHVHLSLKFVKNFGIPKLEWKLRKIPRRLRPSLLSEVVSEQLCNFAECDACINLIRLKNVIQSCQFVDGILSLIKKNTGQDEEFTIRSRLASLRLQPVSSLTTILVYENENIESSIRERDLFWTKENQEVVIYTKNNTERYLKWLKTIFSKLSNVVNYCTRNSNLPEMLLRDILDVEDPLEIPGLIGQFIGAEEAPASWLPPLGSSVPLHFHELLDNSLHGDSIRFRPGELAVYEVYDTSIDNNDPSGDAEYIYVKVVRVLEKESSDEFFQMYEIFDGHSSADVYSFRLYKMIRQPNASTQEMVVFTDGHEGYSPANRDGIFKEIMKTLARAWRRDHSDFKRILKRMLLRWHPDKNVSQQEFCTEVTQFILDIVRRLENGEDVYNEEQNYSYNRWREDYRRQDFSSWSYGSGSGSGSAFAFGTGVGESAIRRRRRYSNYYGGCTRSSPQPPNPQPGSAKRWLDQAKCDLDSANREMERERQEIEMDLSQCNQNEDAQRPIFNWICYKAHQAAEKALKALLLNIDANKLSDRKFTSHELQNLVLYEHTDLRELAREFRGLVPDHTTMRYPQNFTQGRIPTDVFEKKDAKKALELAEKILDIVDGRI